MGTFRVYLPLTSIQPKSKLTRFHFLGRPPHPISGIMKAVVAVVALLAVHAHANVYFEETFENKDRWVDSTSCVPPVAYVSPAFVVPFFCIFSALTVFLPPKFVHIDSL